MSGRAVIYARYSTELQDGRSIDDQVALCRDFAERSGLTVTEVFADRAKTSASIFGRDGLARMMERGKARAFDVVVVEALDRLSRDQEDLSHIFKRLTFARVDILTVHDGRADSVAVGLRGLMGTMFLDALRQKTRRGLAGVIRDGRSAGGRSYGYRAIDGKPGERTVDAAEAEVIRRIFRDYVAGVSPRAIAGALNQQGVLPPRGTRWAASSINGNPARGYGILRNPMYDGRLVWNRVMMVRDPDTGRRVNRENPRDQWQEVAAEHLRIVPQALFRAAVARQAQQAHAVQSGTMTRAPKRPFSGLIHCGCCGGGMTIHDRVGKAIRIRCSTASQSGSCTNTGRFRLDRIEAAILGRLRDQMDRPDYLAEFVRTYTEERRRLTAAARRDLARIERTLASAEARHDRLVNMMADGVISGPSAKSQILEARAAADQARDTRNAATAPERVVTLHPRLAETYAAAIDQLASSVHAPGVVMPPAAIEALRRIVTDIVVTPGPGHLDASVEVRGNLALLLGLEDEKVGGSMVARGRLAQDPHLFPRFALG